MNVLRTLLVTLAAVCYALPVSNAAGHPRGREVPSSAPTVSTPSVPPAPRYNDTWESLDSRPLPEWSDERKCTVITVMHNDYSHTAPSHLFSMLLSVCYVLCRYDDAKFGIFIHWYDNTSTHSTFHIIHHSIPHLPFHPLTGCFHSSPRGVYSVPAWSPVGQYAEWYWERQRNQDDGGVTARFQNGQQPPTDISPLPTSMTVSQHVYHLLTSPFLLLVQRLTVPTGVIKISLLSSKPSFSTPQPGLISSVVLVLDILYRHPNIMKDSLCGHLHSPGIGMQ